MNLFVLFQARNEIKHLEDQAKLLEKKFERLKQKRDLLRSELKEKTLKGIFFYSFICNSIYICHLNLFPLPDKVN